MCRRWNHNWSAFTSFEACHCKQAGVQVRWQFAGNLYKRYKLSGKFELENEVGVILVNPHRDQNLEIFLPEFAIFVIFFFFIHYFMLHEAFLAMEVAIYIYIYIYIYDSFLLLPAAAILFLNIGCTLSIRLLSCS